MINDVVEINLNGQIYRAKLDMGAIAKAQWNLMKLKENMTIVQMFELVQKENYMVINTLLIESIKRCHAQLSDENILANMKIKERNIIIESVIELFKVSLPKDDKKKE